MYLKRLEIQGFKTFAQKTVLEFKPVASGRRGVTAIVGPNGSGKSNAADAIRWVMGEQSLKLLRGKKSEDVIFSGSDKRSRSGFAEATMVLENEGEDRTGLDVGEIAVTRRLYRDGQSEYEVNRQSARLQDVALLLAQAGIGQRTYSVIGQGMIDHVLVASPTERKEFFDEAFGLKPFQLKRQSALNKIDESKKNLGQTESLLNEIGPRLATLERQIKRLAERDTLQAELQSLERAYYGSEWHQIDGGIKAATSKLEQARVEQAKLVEVANKLEAELSEMEKATPRGDGFKELRAKLDAVAAEKAALRERELKLETQKAVAAVRAEKPWAPLPLSKIIEAIESLREAHEDLVNELGKASPDIAKAKKLAESLRLTSVDLAGKLQRPAPEPEQSKSEMDPEVEKELKEIAKAYADLAEQTMKANAELESWNRGEDEKRSHIFKTQHELSQKRAEAQSSERRAGDVSIELARLETRRDGLLADLRLHAPTLEQELAALAVKADKPEADAAARMQKLRSQLEWIGGIDPETIKDHGETKERFEFLSKQIEDLRQGIQALDLVVAELDSTIRDRSATAFTKLNREFSSYFKKLFNGGEASLVEMQPEPETDEEGNIISEPAEGEVAGVDIQATPPGKRFKSIALLSGGERALTSIALICAIMATNPSPFVVLDEVDAALDESNSRKFAEIIGTLADKTQFVVVTHNRATMMQASVLYGVTMGDDGVSQLLSVDFADVEKLRKN
ncbi:AAA family ATPase [Candidatus Uhrbacteria bacterium]|nr:MAG: AAA family ATPase [Candidatus Uhrbacteria bacterium]